jgi:hypothetical protein
MYPSDEKLRINDYGTIILDFVTKPNRNDKAILKTELNKLNINKSMKINGEASSSTLVEDLASHVKMRQEQIKTRH